MLTERFRNALQEYHRKHWFPADYADPFGEFVDYISEGMVADLLAGWEKEKNPSYLNVGRYLLQLLPEIQFHELFFDYRKAFSQRLHSDTLPEFIPFALRNLAEENSVLLWRDLQHWSDLWETRLENWIVAVLNFEKNHAEFDQRYAGLLRLPNMDDTHLRSSRELFAWQLQNKTAAKDYRELLKYYRLEKWRNVADWQDLPALAKSIQETCGYSSPVLKKADQPAAQFLFPVLPPARVLLEYGSSSGPFEAMRFLIELGKGNFYASMNPDLRAEDRICGDPSLPWFWGYLCASLLSDPEAVRVFIGSKAESMPEETRFILQCWYRHELFLTAYRSCASTNWKNVQDYFASLWELTYPLNPPMFLALFELSRSAESIYRCTALMRSQQVIQHLQSQYGRRWFSDRKWIQRAREYCWEGFRMTTNDIVVDLKIQEPAIYPF